MPEDGRCFLVTYAFSVHAPAYWKAIWIRDQILLPTRTGRYLVSHYYRKSPRWIEYFRSNPFFLPLIKFVVRFILRLFPDRKRLCGEACPDQIDHTKLFNLSRFLASQSSSFGVSMILGISG